MSTYFIVRGWSGFVRVWEEEIIYLFENDPDYTILGRDLSEEEAHTLAHIANINIRNLNLEK